MSRFYCDLVICAVSSITNVHLSTNQPLTHGQSLTCFCENYCYVDDTHTHTDRDLESVLDESINLRPAQTVNDVLCVSVCTVCVRVSVFVCVWCVAGVVCSSKANDEKNRVHGVLNLPSCFQ